MGSESRLTPSFAVGDRVKILDMETEGCVTSVRVYGGQDDPRDISYRYEVRTLNGVYMRELGLERLVPL